MNQVRPSDHLPSKKDTGLTYYQQQLNIMQEDEYDKGIQIELKERSIKVALITDSNQYKINIVLPHTQGTQAVSLFTSRFKVEQSLSNTVDETFFGNIYFPTCLITNEAVYTTFYQSITHCFYICHVIIIQRPCYLQAPLEPTSKIIRMKEQEIISAIKQPIAHNFFVSRDIKSQQFKQKVRDILQLKRSTDFYRRQWQKYLRIAGFGEQQAKDFMDKYRPTDENVLRLYSQSSHIYHINIILRRCNHPSALQYIGLIVYLLYKGIARCVLPKRIPQYNRVCFRGGYIGLQEVQQLSSAQVEHVLCRHFMSCSLNPNVAQLFRTNCIFQIHFQPDSGCAILQESVHRDEQEVLFSILCSFRVMSIREDRMRGKPGWYVVLNYEGPTIQT